MRRMIFILSLMGILAFLVTGASGQNAGAWLKSSYLKSIHDDCRIFLEGIELFTERDYAAFIKSARTFSGVKQQDAETYVEELRHFEKLLDSVYEEFVSFKDASLSAEEKAAGQTVPLTPMEKQIFQMLTYCYLRTGDVIMAQNIVTNNDILTDDFTIRIRRMDGRMRDFYLTRELTTLYKTTLNRLAVLTLHVNNFLVSNIGEMNAFIKLTGYDPSEPVNILYLAYYGSLLPGLTAEKGRMVHLGQIVSFFNRLKYSSSSSMRPFLSGEASDYTVAYQFPIVKGVYELISEDPTIRIRRDSDTEIVVERLCLFKGLARTDFRGLKDAARLMRDETQTMVEADFTLFRVDDQSFASHVTGQMIPYGIYALFENQRQLGSIEILPCGQGGGCKQRFSTDPAVTQVRVFDHDFVLYNDVLDLVKSNHSRYGKNLDYDALLKLSRTKRSRTPQQAPSPSQVKLFPGCAGANQ